MDKEKPGRMGYHLVPRDPPLRTKISFRIGRIGAGLREFDIMSALFWAYQDLQGEGV